MKNIRQEVTSSDCHRAIAREGFEETQWKTAKEKDKIRQKLKAERMNQQRVQKYQCDKIIATKVEKLQTSQFAKRNRKTVQIIVSKFQLLQLFQPMKLLV